MSYVLNIKAHALPYLATCLLQVGFKHTAQAVLEEYVHRTSDPEEMVSMVVGPKVREIMAKDTYLFIRGSVTEHGKDTEGRTARDSGHTEDQDAADGGGSNGRFDPPPQ